MVGRLQADPRWQAIDVLSDLHLQAATPRTAQALVQHLRHTAADAVLLLGDIFEAWVGDDARHQPFESGLLARLREAAAGRMVGFMAGNRDFLVGSALLAEMGWTPLADPTLLHAFGRDWLLSHGDALCVADRDYQRFRAEVRGEAWQRAFLQRPLAERLALARQMRDASMRHQAGQAPEAQAEVDADAARAWLAATGAQVLLHGHTHRPGSHALGEGCSRAVLGDWDFDAPVTRGRILRLDATGLHPIDLTPQALGLPPVA